MHKHFKDSYNSLFFNNFNNLKSLFGLVRWNRMIIHEYDIYLIEEQSSLKYLVSDFRFQNVSYVFFNAILAFFLSFRTRYFPPEHD